MYVKLILYTSCYRIDVHRRKKIIIQKTRYCSAKVGTKWLLHNCDGDVLFLYHFE
jgi:hypothetical protein